jgi:hypothetical protein
MREVLSQNLHASGLDEPDRIPNAVYTISDNRKGITQTHRLRLVSLSSLLHTEAETQSHHIRLARTVRRP